MDVAPRTFPGINKAGGTGTITKVNDERSKDGGPMKDGSESRTTGFTYAVKYTISGSEKRVDAQWIARIDDEEEASDGSAGGGDAADARGGAHGTPTSGARVGSHVELDGNANDEGGAHERKVRNSQLARVCGFFCHSTREVVRKRVCRRNCFCPDARALLPASVLKTWKPALPTSHGTRATKRCFRQVPNFLYSGRDATNADRNAGLGGGIGGRIGGDRALPPTSEAPHGGGGPGRSYSRCRRRTTGRSPTRGSRARRSAAAATGRARSRSSSSSSSSDEQAGGRGDPKIDGGLSTGRRRVVWSTRRPAKRPSS